jgi:tetratricopeptide (TPR) repeat protein
MLIYDQRIEHFGNHPKYNEGWILGRKGVDIVTYRRSDIGSLKQAIECFEHAYGKQHNRLEPTVAVNWLQATNVLVKHGDLTGHNLLDVYLNVDEVLTSHISKTESEKKKALLYRVSATCSEILTKSGLDDCSELETQLQARFESVKNDQKGIERILFLLDGLNCTGGDLYARAAERNYELQPTPRASYLLAKYFIKQNQFDKAQEYYLKTISQADEDELRAKCFYELAVITFSHFQNSPQARTYAQSALKIKQKWGKPHILIGNIYAQESTKYGKDDFEHSTVYWVAIDRFKRARTLDPECAPEAEKQINLYSQYIPDKETGFFHGIKEGDAYTIGSWINEKTTVRYR